MIQRSQTEYLTYSNTKTSKEHSQGIKKFHLHDYFENFHQEKSVTLIISQKTKSLQ
jgi:hypothetical protein